ncbi:galectin-7 [Tachyglossus aculeatus]|uniref:galectin-7 n=1 Tax=Tachyglossus aculeatus TaxID=9261 RepID=UPI0018F73833|nr:galectin-7 [Tachyglossus aculeatus]
MASENLSVPHKVTCAEGLRPGTVVRLRGVVPQEASRFHVNFLCGEEAGADTALHLNPRLDTSEVVFNSFEGGSWKKEERGRGLPFRRGDPFDLLLIAADDGYKVVIGDNEYHKFAHRMPPQRVRGLEVGGDVLLQAVRIF